MPFHTLEKRAETTLLVLSGFVVKRASGRSHASYKKLVTGTQLFASQAAEVLDISCHLHQTCLHQVLKINLILQLSLQGFCLPLGVLQQQRKKKKSGKNNKNKKAISLDSEISFSSSKTIGNFSVCFIESQNYLGWKGPLNPAINCIAKSTTKTCSLVPHLHDF